MDTDREQCTALALGGCLVALRSIVLLTEARDGLLGRIRAVAQEAVQLAEQSGIGQECLALGE